MLLPVHMTLKGSSGVFLQGDSLMICSTRSMTRQLRPFLVQDLLKPLCTKGRLPYLPRLGGCTTRHACIPPSFAEGMSLHSLHLPNE